jgi:DNA uptake protein ComE-like DNA-binding protein
MSKQMNRGFVLIVVLWVMVVLGLIGLAFHGTTRLNTHMTRNLLETTRAGALADSGIQRAIAALRQDEDQNTYDSLKDIWINNEAAFGEVEIAQGFFSLIYDDLETDDHLTYGCIDEESKLNLNTATEEMLRALPGINQGRAAAILDWRDEDDQPRPQGAEDGYYLSLPRPYKARNGSFETLEELLMVRGINDKIFYGEDLNRNGVLDRIENDGSTHFPNDNEDGILDRGISRYLTVYSYEKNVDGDGEKRLNINKASEDEFKQRLGSYLSDDEIKGIIQYRKDSGEGSAFNTIGDLLDAKVGDATGERRGRRSEGSGKKILTEEKFKQICDSITVNGNDVIPGRINVNTAPEVVLKAVFRGKDGTLAKQIISRRTSEGPFENLGGLLDVKGLDTSTFKRVCPFLCVRSNVFSVRSVGYQLNSRAMVVVEAVVDRGSTPYRIRYYRHVR